MYLPKYCLFLYYCITLSNKIYEHLFLISIITVTSETGVDIKPRFPNRNLRFMYLLEHKKTFCGQIMHFFKVVRNPLFHWSFFLSFVAVWYAKKSLCNFSCLIVCSICELSLGIYIGSIINNAMNIVNKRWKHSF